MRRAVIAVVVTARIVSLAAAVRYRAGAALVVFGSALAIAACGGNTPATPNPPPPPPPPQVRFTPMENPESDAIGLALSSATAAEFTLTLNATEVTDLYGYGVDIVFDPAVIMFESAEPGPFLRGEGVRLNSQLVEQPDGTLVIGQTRVGNAPGVNGSGTLLTLNFTSVAAGSTTLETANAGAFDSSGAALETTFFGGTATVPAQTAR